jgi:hypothetical protein
MSIFIPKARAASAALVAELEKRFGVALPTGYLAFLKDYDGARPENNMFELGTHNSVGVDQFIPAEESIHVREVVDGFPSNVLPVARATSGNIVYLVPASGAIYFWDHENDAGDIKLADSFDDFLSMLQRFDVQQVKLKPEQVSKVWVNPNFKPKF